MARALDGGCFSGTNGRMVIKPCLFVVGKNRETRYLVNLAGLVTARCLNDARIGVKVLVLSEAFGKRAVAGRAC